MRLTETTFTVLEDHVRLTENALAEMGFSLRVDGDMQRFIDWLDEQPDNHDTPKTHDPKYTYMREDEAFWVYVVHNDSGRIAACHGQRLLVTEDFISDVRNQRYFRNRPRLHLDPLTLYPEATKVKLSGRLCLGGGCYIHPDFRERKTGRSIMIFNRCSRSLALREFKGDAVIGTLLNTKNRNAWAKGSVGAGVGYEKVCPFLIGGMPGKPQAQDVILAWSTTAQWLKTVDAELQDAGRSQSSVSRPAMAVAAAGNPG